MLLLPSLISLPCSGVLTFFFFLHNAGPFFFLSCRVTRRSKGFRDRYLDILYARLSIILWHDQYFWTGEKASDGVCRNFGGMENVIEYLIQTYMCMRMCVCVCVFAPVVAPFLVSLCSEFKTDFSFALTFFHLRFFFPPTCVYFFLQV